MEPKIGECDRGGSQFIAKVLITAPIVQPHTTIALQFINFERKERGLMAHSICQYHGVCKAKYSCPMIDVLLHLDIEYMQSDVNQDGILLTWLV